MILRFLICALALWLCAASVLAAHIPLDVPDRRDYAFDHNGILYISTNGGSILRYDTRASSFLEPYSVGGRPIGIDLSLDGSTLAVADSSPQGGNQRIVLVDTAFGTQTEALFPRYSMEHGTFMVAWGG
jgi:DNA-binding beta-propeller fold protein YncE